MGWKQGRKSFPWIRVGLVLTLLFFALNWCYHAYHKPSEVVGLADSFYFKSPEETWQAYGTDFREKSTALITPELLAALAQTETAGNTIARTFWQWNLSTNPFKIYSPASSAVGLLQMTNGTFEQAKQFCISDNRVHSTRQGRCQNRFYNRVVPSHSIEMTSAWLHVNTESILKKIPKKKKRNAKTTLAQKRKLAAVIHLCGTRRGESYARRRFRFRTGEKCGSIGVRSYIAKVQRFEKIFSGISKRNFQAIR